MNFQKKTRQKKRKHRITRAQRRSLASKPHPPEETIIKDSVKKDLEIIPYNEHSILNFMR